MLSEIAIIIDTGAFYSFNDQRNPFFVFYGRKLLNTIEVYPKQRQNIFHVFCKYFKSLEKSQNLIKKVFI